MVGEITQKRVGVKLHNRYYLCTVTGIEGAVTKEVVAVCVKNADKVIFKVHSAEANPSNLVELLTEGLDRKLHLDRFKRTLARIPTRNKSARPHSAPSGGRRHHRQSSSMRLSIDSAEGGDELAYLALTADGPMTTPRTVKLLKGSKKMEEKEVGDEKEGEKDAFDKPSHCPTSNKLKGLTPSASEVKGVGAAKAKEQHIQVPTLKRLQSLPTVLDGLSKPGFSPRDPDQRVDERLLKAHVSAKPLRDPVALQRMNAKARAKPVTPKKATVDKVKEVDKKQLASVHSPARASTGKLGK